MKKHLRFTAFVLAAILALGIVSSAFAFSKNDVLQATANVYVRKGPGTGYAKLGTLKKGGQVVFLAKSGSWSKVTYEGQTAYIHSKYLALKTGGTTPATGSVYATTNVNVRKGPGTSYAKLGQLEKDQKVEKVGSSGRWVKIVYGSGYGYVYDSYLTAQAPAGGGHTPIGTSSPGLYLPINVSATTTVYKDASYIGGTLGTISAGTTVYYTGMIINNFVQIYYGGGLGYIPTTTIIWSTGGTIYPQRQVIQATTIYGNVVAGTPSNPLGTLAVSDRVYCVDTVGSYTRIVHNGGYAFVLTAHLSGSAIGGGGWGYNPLGNNTIKYDTFIFTQPMDSAGVINSIASGTRVLCTGLVANGYAQLLLSDSSYGYVAVGALTDTVTGGGGGLYVTKRLAMNSALYNAVGGAMVGIATSAVDVTLVASYGIWSQISWGGVTYFVYSTYLS